MFALKSSKKRNILIISLIIPLLHVAFSPSAVTQSGRFSEYALGFPFHFIWYRSFDGFVSNKLSLFTTEFTHTQIDPIYYLFSILVIYFILTLALKFIEHILYNLNPQKTKL